VTATPRAVELAVAAAEAASDKLAKDIVAIDVSDVLVITDVFVIASGGNERQVKAIVDAVEERMHLMGSSVCVARGRPRHAGSCSISATS